MTNPKTLEQRLVAAAKKAGREREAAQAMREYRGREGARRRQHARACARCASPRKRPTRKPRRPSRAAKPKAAPRKRAAKDERPPLEPRPQFRIPARSIPAPAKAAQRLYRAEQHSAASRSSRSPLLPLVALWAAAWFAVLVRLSVGDPFLIALPAAGFLVRLFMIQHDCGHGSFFSDRHATTGSAASSAC